MWPFLEVVWKIQQIIEPYLFILSTPEVSKVQSHLRSLEAVAVLDGQSGIRKRDTQAADTEKNY